MFRSLAIASLVVSFAMLSLTSYLTSSYQAPVSAEAQYLLQYNG